MENSLVTGEVWRSGGVGRGPGWMQWPQPGTFTLREADTGRSNVSAASRVQERAVPPVGRGRDVREHAEAEGRDDRLRARPGNSRAGAQEVDQCGLLGRAADERRRDHVIGVAVEDAHTTARDHV